MQGDTFSNDEKSRIFEAIKKKYASVAENASGFFSYPVGREGATLLNYPEHMLATINDSQLQSFCGVGNPFSIKPIDAGTTVLDIGCGAGIDCYIAAKFTGPKGKVIGVDMTPAMAEKARRNLQQLNCENAEILDSDITQLPIEDSSVDVVISNGVINLAPDKRKVFAEIFRVLKPGGRLQFADIILEKELPPHLAVGVESWSQ